jgi:hypothetical protein
MSKHSIPIYYEIVYVNKSKKLLIGKKGTNDKFDKEVNLPLNYIDPIYKFWKYRHKTNDALIVKVKGKTLKKIYFASWFVPSKWSGNIPKKPASSWVPIIETYEIVHIDKDKKSLIGVNEFGKTVKLKYNRIINDNVDIPEYFRLAKSQGQRFFITTKDGFFQCSFVD